MLKIARHQIILQIINESGKVYTKALSQQMDVSLDTVRRDLKELAVARQLIKVHGGAIAVNANIIPARRGEVYARTTKIKVAQKAVSLIEDGAVIMVDGGTTNLELVSLLPKDIHIILFTNSLPIALKSCEFQNIETTFIGGRVYKYAKATIGVDVSDFVKDVHPDLFFMGVHGVHPKSGLTGLSREEAVNKQVMIDVSKRTISLVISEKIGVIEPFKIVPIKKVDTIVTELPKSDVQLDSIRNLGTILI